MIDSSRVGQLIGCAEQQMCYSRLGGGRMRGLGVCYCRFDCMQLARVARHSTLTAGKCNIMDEKPLSCACGNVWHISGSLLAMLQ